MGIIRDTLTQTHNRRRLSVNHNIVIDSGDSCLVQNTKHGCNFSAPEILAAKRTTNRESQRALPEEPIMNRIILWAWPICQYPVGYVHVDDDAHDN